MVSYLPYMLILHCIAVFYFSALPSPWASSFFGLLLDSFELLTTLLTCCTLLLSFIIYVSTFLIQSCIPFVVVSFFSRLEGLVRSLLVFRLLITIFCNASLAIILSPSVSSQISIIPHHFCSLSNPPVYPPSHTYRP